MALPNAAEQIEALLKHRTKNNQTTNESSSRPLPEVVEYRKENAKSINQSINQLTNQLKQLIGNRKLRVLIVDNYDSFTHNITQLINQLTDCECLVVYNDLIINHSNNQSNDQLINQLLELVDCVIISPGPGRPDRPADIGITDIILRDNHSYNKQSNKFDPPVFGVCLGLQSLVTINQGKIVHADHTMHGRPSTIYHQAIDQANNQLINRSVFDGINEPFSCIRYNSLIASLIDWPSNLMITAVSETGEIMGVDQIDEQYIDQSTNQLTNRKRIYSVQFHPESICSEQGHRMFYNFFSFLSADKRFAHRIDDQLIEQSINQSDLYQSIDSRHISSTYWSHDAWFASLIAPHQSSHQVVNKSIEQPTSYSLMFKTIPWIDSQLAFTLFETSQSNSWWLDSSATDNNRARWSFMGNTGDQSLDQPTCQSISYQLNNRTLTAITNNQSKGQSVSQVALSAHEDFFSYLDSIVLNHSIDQSVNASNNQSVSIDSLPFPFKGGWVGYVGYEMRAETEPNSQSNNQIDAPNAPSVQQSDQPDAAFLFVDRFLAFDHQENIVYIIALADQSNSSSAVQASSWIDLTRERLDTLHDQSINQTANQSINQSMDEASVDWKWRDTESVYQSKINQCLEEIRNGESYELCMTTQVSAHLPIDQPIKQSLGLYHILRTINPSSNGSYFNFASMINQTNSFMNQLSQQMKPFCIVSCSPEKFLGVEKSGVCRMRPIKGTISRDLNDPYLDQQRINHLKNSEKDYSENLMILDLVRSDLSRACLPGSVKVEGLMEIETYATLHNLVSTVEAQIDPLSGSSIKLLKSTFPPGSMTGAPKLRSCHILEKLENGPRGIYSGSLGYISLAPRGQVNALDMNVVIRTIVLEEDRVSIGVGGAIIDASSPQDEWDEIQLKARAARRAVQIWVARASKTNKHM